LCQRQDSRTPHAKHRAQEVEGNNPGNNIPLSYPLRSDQENELSNEEAKRKVTNNSDVEASDNSEAAIQPPENSIPRSETPDPNGSKFFTRPFFRFKDTFKRTKAIPITADNNIEKSPRKLPKLPNVSELSSQVVAMDELSNDDVLIAVMGPTGSGKSSFITMASGSSSNLAGVGHTLQSCTSEISIVRVQSVELGINVVLVDTPGFDDTNRSDVDILKMVSKWLKKTYEQHIYLSGILYFHRISDNRMAGTPLKNLKMFQELCGPDAFSRIILTTTMWDEVEIPVGEQREKELKEKYWKPMMDLKSKTERYHNSHESAWEILRPVVESVSENQAILLQEEMVDMKKQLSDTSAGRALYSKMEELVNKQQDLLRRIRIESKKSAGDKTAMKALMEEYSELREKMKTTITEMHAIRPSLAKRVLKYFKFERD